MCIKMIKIWNFKKVQIKRIKKFEKHSLLDNTKFGISTLYQNRG